MSHHFLLIIHLICAAVWIGGHLYLSVSLLPKALKRKEPQHLLQFAHGYEPLGMPALLLLVVTGIWMSLQFGIGWQQWFSFSSPVERVVSLKLTLLFATLLLALNAQFRVVPALKNNAARLPEMAFHIIAVTLIGITMLVLGSFIRYGGL